MVTYDLGHKRIPLREKHGEWRYGIQDPAPKWKATNRSSLMTVKPSSTSSYRDNCAPIVITALFLELELNTVQMSTQ